MVARRNIVVFGLCTAFVLGFYAVLSYEAAAVQLETLHSKGPAVPCTFGDPCSSFAIGSATLTSANFTDELGPAGYSNLTLRLVVSGNFTISSFEVYIGGTKVGTVEGPIGPGSARALSFTLPSTDKVTVGDEYTLSVAGSVPLGEGADSATVWKVVYVVAG